MIHESHPAHPSNYRSGRQGLSPLGIMLHTTGGTAEGSARWFQMSVEQRTAANRKALIDAWRNTGFGSPEPTAKQAQAFPSSAHFIITRQGKCWQAVSIADTAYHAGGSWTLAHRIKYPWVAVGQNANLTTIGIEHEVYPGALDWPLELVEASRLLCRQLASQYGFKLSASRLLRHSEVMATECPVNMPPLNYWLDD